MRKMWIPALLLLATFGCTPEFWDGVARGYAGSSNAYAPSSADAGTREKVCAKYMTRDGWSNGYHVSANVIKGSELNRRTLSYNYEPYSTYVVIFWDQGEASVIKLDYFYGSLSPYGVEGEDQQGRKWQVAKTSFCY